MSKLVIAFIISFLSVLSIANVCSRQSWDQFWESIDGIKARKRHSQHYPERVANLNPKPGEIVEVDVGSVGRFRMKDGTVVHGRVLNVDPRKNTAQVQDMYTDRTREVNLNHLHFGDVADSVRIGDGISYTSSRSGATRQGVVKDINEYGEIRYEFYENGKPTGELSNYVPRSAMRNLAVNHPYTIGDQVVLTSLNGSSIRGTYLGETVDSFIIRDTNGTRREILIDSVDVDRIASDTIDARKRSNFSNEHAHMYERDSAGNFRNAYDSFEASGSSALKKGQRMALRTHDGKNLTGEFFKVDNDYVYIIETSGERTKVLKSSIKETQIPNFSVTSHSNNQYTGTYLGEDDRAIYYIDMDGNHSALDKSRLRMDSMNRPNAPGFNGQKQHWEHDWSSDNSANSGSGSSGNGRGGARSDNNRGSAGNPPRNDPQPGRSYEEMLRDQQRRQANATNWKDSLKNREAADKFLPRFRGVRDRNEAQAILRNIRVENAPDKAAAEGWDAEEVMRREKLIQDYIDGFNRLYPN